MELVMEVYLIGTFGFRHVLYYYLNDISSCYF